MDDLLIQLGVMALAPASPAPPLLSLVHTPPIQEHATRVRDPTHPVHVSDSGCQAVCRSFWRDNPPVSVTAVVRCGAAAAIDWLGGQVPADTHIRTWVTIAWRHAGGEPPPRVRTLEVMGAGPGLPNAIRAVGWVDSCLRGDMALTDPAA
jgi:hypothetical protein